MIQLSDSCNYFVFIFSGGTNSSMVSAEYVYVQDAENRLRFQQDASFRSLQDSLLRIEGDLKVFKADVKADMNKMEAKLEADIQKLEGNMTVSTEKINSRLGSIDKYVNTIGYVLLPVLYVIGLISPNFKFLIDLIKGFISQS